MTARGEPRRALSLAYSASFFGGIFSVICLILFAPVLAKIAPMFGSREIFLAALLGIVLVIVAHRGQSLIAGALACFGIFIQTIGLEPVKYTSRYTFDQPFLSGGINLIVVVLGLFALSQAFVLLTSEDEKVRMAKLKGGMFQGLRELARHPRVASVSASFGVVMGMIPGVGEFTAQFMSYTYAQKSSKRPQDFGNGSSEGLIAAETANNAVPAAAMVPLLALGHSGRGADGDDAFSVLRAQCCAGAGSVPESDGFCRRALSRAFDPECAGPDFPALCDPVAGAGSPNPQPFPWGLHTYAQFRLASTACATRRPIA